MGRLLEPLLETGLPLIKNLLEPSAKSLLIPLRLTAAASATAAAIHKKTFRFGIMKLIISNKEMNDVMKIAKSLEKYGLLIKSVRETNKNEAKEKKGKFLGTLGATLLGNLLQVKEQLEKVKVR